MPELKGDLTFRVKAEISDKMLVLCTDCKEQFTKDSMWSVYCHGDINGNDTFKGVCQECRVKEIANPKGWKDMAAENKKKWEKKANK